MAVNILFGEISRKLSGIHNEIRKIEQEQSSGQSSVTSSAFAAFHSLKPQIESFEMMAKREVTEIKREKSMRFVVACLLCSFYREGREPGESPERETDITQRER